MIADPAKQYPDKAPNRFSSLLGSHTCKTFHRIFYVTVSVLAVLHEILHQLTT